MIAGLPTDSLANTLEEVRGDTRGERDGRRRRLMVENVGLSTVQKAAVDSLVSVHRPRMSDLGREFQPRYRTVIADLREEIKLVLTDDQRATYDVLLAEYDAERTARRRNNSRK
jgi:hypothetical protein